MRTDLKKQEINVQDHVAQHYEDMRYRLSHSRRYHLWWTTEMLKGTKDTGLWLDLGCGTGWNLSVLQLLEHKRKAIGIDLSDGMLRLAKEKNLTIPVMYYPYLTVVIGITLREKRCGDFCWKNMY